MNNYSIAALILGSCISIALLVGASRAIDNMGGANPDPSTDENDTDGNHQPKAQQQGDNDQRTKAKKPQHEHLKEKATAELLRLLSTEIARDGGASVVTSLKDYFSMNGKRFNSLLYHSIGQSKLLRFFEHHSDIFAVDRNHTPHVVQLLSRQHVNNQDLKSKDNKKIDETLDIVRNKASYVLQRRQAKLNRRRKKQRTTKENNSYAVTDTAEANLSWLLEESVVDVHLYLRASGFYVRELLDKTIGILKRRSDAIPVPLVGSREWQDLVMDEFGQILKADPESRFAVSNAVESNIPRVWLSHLDPNIVASNVNSETNEDGVSGNGHNDLDETETLDQDYLDRVVECLEKVVHQDGGHEVKLVLLLHRHVELKRILGGRDFSIIYQKCKVQFQSSGISCRQEGADWIFWSEQTADSKYNGGGRMMVDEVGLYSVTNSKWGTAIGNIMVHCCKTTLGDNKSKKLKDSGGLDEKSESKGDHPKLTLVDMTASVGGMTLGLAKTEYFDEILAYEVDSERANLCQANMERHGVDSIVQVRNQDSVEALSSFPPSKDHQYCFVIDPPWGGVAYKQKTKRYSQFFMGPWSLKDVLVRMYTHCRPCLVGLRLPEDRAKVNDLLEELRKENLHFETKTIRKLSVQRFVVLYFLPE